MNRNFNNWLSSFRESIADYKYYMNFEKVYRNVNKIKVELNIINSLIGSANIKEDFKVLLEKYPEVLQCIPLLLAVRAQEIYCQDANSSYVYRFVPDKYPLESQEEYERYAYFMEQTGIFEILEKHIVSNVLDYVTGVETGIESNGRKNRGGLLMENLVEEYIQKAGFVINDNYFKQMEISQISRRWGIDISAISNRGKTEKRFDFVVKTPNTIYAIETNFYAAGGSKLNETARSYKTLALESKMIEGFSFVWFTDGRGWKSARSNLEETYDVMEHIYNIKDIEAGIIGKAFK